MTGEEECWVKVRHGETRAAEDDDGGEKSWAAGIDAASAAIAEAGEQPGKEAANCWGWHGARGRPIMKQGHANLAWHALRADHACCTPALDGYGFQRIQN